MSLSPHDLLNRGYTPANSVVTSVATTGGTANSTPTITTKALPEAFVGQNYSQVIDVTCRILTTVENSLGKFQTRQFLILK